MADKNIPETTIRVMSWSRTLVVAAATLAVLVLGAAVGMLITLASVKQADIPGADSVDVGFAQDMSAHHYQAVSMASWTRDHTIGPSIKQLAFDIEKTQGAQIGRMAGWLELWGQPELPPGPQHMAWMTATSSPAGHDHNTTGGGTTTMPGMATATELAKLYSLSGRELDVYFLQ